MPSTTFDISDGGVSPQQAAAEQNALEQGEKIAQALEEDRQRTLQNLETEQEDVALIGGKFKSQDDLLKAYEELQKKLGTTEPEEGEEPVGEQGEATEEAPEETQEVSEEVAEAVTYMNDLGRKFDEQGTLEADDIEKLSSMDSKQLVEAYLAYNQQAKSAQMQQGQVDSIMELAGGAQGYADLVQWAGQNLPAEEVNDFNAVTATNNPVAIKFAVQSLMNRYRGEVGYEAPLVSGKAAPETAKAFRSHAELSRAIADPRYKTDPAFRADVEARLARSADLL